MSALTKQNSRRAWVVISNMVHPTSGRPIISQGRLDCFKFLCDHAWDEDEYGIGISRPDLEFDWDRKQARRISDLPVLGLAIEVGPKPSRDRNGDPDSSVTCAAYQPVLPGQLPDETLLRANLQQLRAQNREMQRLRERALAQVKDTSDNNLLFWEDSLKRMCDEIDEHVLPHLSALHQAKRVEAPADRLKELQRRLQLAMSRGLSRDPRSPTRPRSKKS